MSAIYASATDKFNGQVFHAIVRAYVLERPDVTTLDLLGLTTPVYDPVGAFDKQNTMLTISRMVELYEGRAYFEICRDYDILDIKHTIDSYIAEVGPYVDRDIKIAQYLKRVEPLKKRMDLLAAITLSRNPAWKEQYEAALPKVGVFLEKLATIRFATPEPPPLPKTKTPETPQYTPLRNPMSFVDLNEVDDQIGQLKPDPLVMMFGKG